MSTEQKDAAVLVPVYRKDDHVYLVFIQRSPNGIYGGQIAFPGGKPEPEDPDLRATALREAQEEIGIQEGQAEILAALPLQDTIAPGFCVHPFLAQLHKPHQLKRCERETQAILHVGLHELTAPEAHTSILKEFPLWPSPKQVNCFKVQGHIIWGLTYKVLCELLPELRKGTWPID